MGKRPTTCYKKGALSLQGSWWLNILWLPMERSSDKYWGVSYWYSLPPAQSPSGPQENKHNYKSSLHYKNSVALNNRPMGRERRECKQQTLTLNCIDQAQSGSAAPSCRHLGWSPQCWQNASGAVHHAERLAPSQKKNCWQYWIVKKFHCDQNLKSYPQYHWEPMYNLNEKCKFSH